MCDRCLQEAAIVPPSREDRSTGKGHPPGTWRSLSKDDYTALSRQHGDRRYGTGKRPSFRDYVSREGLAQLTAIDNEHTGSMIALLPSDDGAAGSPPTTANRQTGSTAHCGSSAQQLT